MIDHAKLRDYQAHFVPGSLRLAAQRGLTYTVSAQLEVTPTQTDEDYDAAIIAAYESHGRRASYLGRELDDFVNDYLPEWADD